MMQRTLWFWALVTVFALSACKTETSEAPPPQPVNETPVPVPNAADPIEQEWTALQTVLNDPKETPHTKLRQAEQFVERHPNDHPRVQSILMRLPKLKKMVGDALLKQSKRAETAKTRIDRELRQKRSKLLNALPSTLALRGLVEVGKWSPDKRDKQFQPVTFTIDDSKKTFKHPIRGSMGLIESGASNIIYEHLPDLQKELNTKYKDYNVYTRASINTLLQHSLKGDLFPTDKPGIVDREYLKRLLATTAIAPNTKILGNPASELYRFIKPALHDHARVYVALRDTVGKGKVLKAYKAALKAEQSTHKGDMRNFYKAYTTKNKLNTLTEDWYGTHVITGFWMRRMADGTDTLLFKTLHKRIGTYDPDFFKTLPKK